MTVKVDESAATAASRAPTVIYENDIPIITDVQIVQTAPPPAYNPSYAPPQSSPSVAPVLLTYSSLTAPSSGATPASATLTTDATSTALVTTNNTTAMTTTATIATVTETAPSRHMVPASNLGRSAAGLQCPYCGRQTVTNVSDVIGVGTVVAVILFAFLFWPLCWLPLVVPSCKRTHHFCGHDTCRKKVGETRVCA